MADISKITLPSGTTYDIKDTVARQMAAAGVTFTISTNAANTPKDVTWDNNGTTITGTLVASASTTGVSIWSKQQPRAEKIFMRNMSRSRTGMIMPGKRSARRILTSAILALWLTRIT